MSVIMLIVIMLIVIMLIVIMLSVIKLNVIMLNVVAPPVYDISYFAKNRSLCIGENCCRRCHKTFFDATDGAARIG